MAALSASQSRAADFDKRVENSLQVKGGAADDLKHIGSGGLLLQRFGKFSRALLLRLEQPHVFNGDHGLVGEGGH